MYKKRKPYTYDIKKCVGQTEIILFLYKEANAKRKRSILEKLNENKTSINTIRFWLDTLLLANILERRDSHGTSIDVLDNISGKTVFYTLSFDAKRLLNDCAKNKKERIFLINILVSFINCEKDYYENEKHILKYLYEKCLRQLENQVPKAFLLEPTDKKLQKFFNNTTDDINLEKYYKYKLTYKEEDKGTESMFYIKSYIKPDGIYLLFHDTTEFKFVKKQDLKFFKNTYYFLIEKDIEQINKDIQSFLKDYENSFYKFRTITIETNEYIALKLTYQNVNIKHIHHHYNNIVIEITAEHSFIYSFLKINMDQISIKKIDIDLLNELKKYFNKANNQLSNLWDYQ